MEGKQKNINLIFGAGIIIHLIHFFLTTKETQWHNYPMFSYISVYPIVLLVLFVEFNILMNRRKAKKMQLEGKEKEMKLKRIDKWESAFFMFMFLYSVGAFVQIILKYEFIN